MPDAIADVATLVPSYRSKTEEAWAGLDAYYLMLEDFEADCTDGDGAIHMPHAYYEPCRFAIPGGHYTPDFMYVMQSGRVVFVEVKGSKRQKGYRDARSKLRAAAAVYPFFTWVEARGGAKGFELEVING